MNELPYKLMSGTGSTTKVHVELVDLREFAAKVQGEYLEMLDAVPLFNQAYRIVLPSNEELRGMRAKRWLIQNV